MDVDFYVMLIQRCFPQLEVRVAQVISSGGDHLMVDINKELLFRFARREDQEDKIVRESKLLPFLEQKLSVPVPHIEYVWRSQREYTHPFIGYRKLHGIWLDDEMISQEQRNIFLPTLATFLRELHAIPVSDAIKHSVRGGTFSWWIELYQARFEQIRDVIFPFLSNTVQRKAERKWESYLALQSMQPFQPVLIHMDLWLNHILCDPHKATLTGVIDWGDATIGDPVLDFVGLDSKWGRDATMRLASMAQEDSSTSFWQRLNFYSEFYLQFYPPYTRALKAFQSSEQDDLYHSVQQIQRSFEE
jgi:aminoglycoside 2''-phosphotransferase